MAKTPSKKSAKAPKKAGKGSKKKARVESYGSYIYKVRSRKTLLIAQSNNNDLLFISHLPAIKAKGLT